MITASANKHVPEKIYISPDSVPSAKRNKQEPLKALKSALDEKQASYNALTVRVKRDMIEKRAETIEAIDDYNRSRGRAVIECFSGNGERGELNASAEINAENESLIEDIDMALGQLADSGDDGASRAVQSKLGAIMNQVSVIEVLSRKALAVSIESEQGAQMHLKQLDNQRRSTLLNIDVLINEAQTVYGEDSELVAVGEDLKDYIENV